MAKPVAKELEGTSEPFKCKTYVLRVSIHCEGCKRKVIKILHNINGVHAIEIDRKQHKVTVTTNTDEQTLIKRLIKAGKHAEPWPEIKPISKNIKEKQIAVEIPAGETSAGKQKQSTETEPPAEELQVPSKNEEKCGINENVQVIEISKGGDGHGDATVTGGGGGPAERAVESSPSIAGETEPGVPSVAVAVEASCSGGGEGRKKKKKKPQRKEKSGGASAGEVVSPQTVPTPASIGLATPLDHHHDQMSSSNHSPPFNQPYNYPVHTAVSQPAYVASYNTVYPSSTYGAYYASPPPYSYAYVHSAAPRNISSLSSSSPVMEQSYAHVYSVASRNISSLSSPEVEQSNSPPSSPFDFFSDENPSGCSIM